ncbi:MAG: hypothetical protein Q9218_007708, partial [Villophora microphyllina]
KSRKSNHRSEIERRSLRHQNKKLKNIRGENDPSQSEDVRSSRHSLTISINTTSGTDHQSNRQTTSTFKEGDRVYCEDEYDRGRPGEKPVRWICRCPPKEQKGKRYYRLKDKPLSDPSAKTVFVDGTDLIFQKDIKMVPHYATMSDDGFITVE